MKRSVMRMRVRKVVADHGGRDVSKVVFAIVMRSAYHWDDADVCDLAPKLRTAFDDVASFVLPRPAVCAAKTVGDLYEKVWTAIPENAREDD